MSESASTRRVVFEGWEMRQWTPSERPKHIDPTMWEKVTQLRKDPLLPYAATAEYLDRIRERLRPFEFATHSDVNSSQRDSARQERAVNSMLKHMNARFKYFDTHLMMEGTVKPKDAFVQDMAQSYAALRMIYPTSELAANLFGELLAHGAGYQVDLFKANFLNLRPPIQAFSSHDRRFEVTANYVARVASEISPVATPLRAVAFRHAMKTGNRSYYWDGDLANAYYAADRARERADTGNSSPVAADQEFSRVVQRIQHALESGRAFDVGKANDLLLGPAQSL
jgi:hypothetical protein